MLPRYHLCFDQRFPPDATPRTDNGCDRLELTDESAHPSNSGATSCSKHPAEPHSHPVPLSEGIDATLPLQCYYYLKVLPYFFYHTRYDLHSSILKRDTGGPLCRSQQKIPLERIAAAKGFMVLSYGIYKTWPSLMLWSDKRL